jgi:hypothetical protein
MNTENLPYRTYIRNVAMTITVAIRSRCSFCLDTEYPDLITAACMICLALQQQQQESDMCRLRERQLTSLYRSSLFHQSTIEVLSIIRHREIVHHSPHQYLPLLDIDGLIYHFAFP